MSKDFRIKQLRTTQVIASGSSVGSVPSLLVYSASAATDIDGNYSADLLAGAGTDVWMFVSGTRNDSNQSNEQHNDKVLFSGDVVISGTLYAEKQVMEVNMSQTSDLYLSGAVVLGDQGAASSDSGQARFYNTIGTNSGSLFVSTGSLYLGRNISGTYSEIQVLPNTVTAGNGIGTQDITDINQSLNIDINELTGSLTNSTIAGSDLFAIADVDATNNEVKKITLTNVAAKLAGDGLSASSGVLSADSRNGINVTSNGIEISLSDVSGSSAIATGDSIPFLDSDGSTQISTVAQLVTALAGDGLTNSSNQFQVEVDDSTIERNTDQLRVKDAGITAAKINSNVAGTGLEQHTDGSIRIAAAAAGNGLTGGAGSAISVGSGNGISVNAGSIEIDDSVVATISGSTFSGPVLSSAFSGSLTHLTDGSSYLVAGANVTITTGSSGAVTIQSTDTDTTYTAGNGLDLVGGSGTEFALDLKSSGGLKLYAGELTVEPSDFAGTGLQDDGSDNLRISPTAAGDGLSGGGGSALAVSTGTGLSISGGNVVTDDSVVAHLSGSVFTGQVEFQTAITGSTDIVIGSELIHQNDPDTKIAFGTNNVAVRVGDTRTIYTENMLGANRVFINPDGEDVDFTVESSNDNKMIFVNGGLDYVSIGDDSGVNQDVHLFVSGAINGVGDSGVAVFGGDVVVSGSLLDSNHNAIKLASVSENGTFANSPSATGTNSVAIGNNATASGNNSIAMGTSTTNQTDATGLHSLAIGGDDATASGQYASAIGGFANTASGNYSLAMGRDNTVSGENSVGIGKSLTVTTDDTIALGNNTDDADIKLKGSVEVLSTLTLPSDIIHAGDSDTKIAFDTNDVSIDAGGRTGIKMTADQAVVLATTAGSYSGTDVAFFVSGTIGSKGDTSTNKGTAVFGGDTAISGTLYFDNGTKIYKDGNNLTFDDGNNTVKTLSQLATVPGESEFLNGVHAGSNASKAATSASFSIAGTQGETYYTENIGSDVLLYVSGGLRSDTAAYGKSTAVFGGAVVFSGSATYLGETVFTNIEATSAVKTPVIQDASGNESIRINSQKLSVGNSINANPNAIFEAPLADNTQAAASNTTDNFNIFINNRSVQTDAFAGIAFDVSTEVDADSIGAAIRAQRDTSAGTTAGLHDANLTFSTNNAGDSGLTERMRITHDGKVGIGVETPGYSLDISGDIMIRGDDIRDSGGNIAVSFDGSGQIDNNVTFTGQPSFEGTNGVLFANDLKHDGDQDTRIRFFDNEISFEAGGLNFLRLDQDTTNQVVFNEGSSDIDFRVESNNETHMLFVDGGTDRIGIGMASPSVTLEIKGANADDTAIVVKDSQSSDTVLKMYHANGEDDGVIDVYTNNAVFTQINGSGDSFFRKNSTSEGAHLKIGRYDASISDSDEIAQLEFQGSENNSSWYTQASIQAKANEDWATNRGTDLKFYTTEKGQNTMTEAMVLSGSGNLQIMGTLELDGNDIIGTALNLDSSGNITIDADGGTITFSDAGVSLGTITSAGYSGNAATATSATSATSATDSTNASNIAITNETATNAERYIVFVDSSTGNNTPKVDSGGLAFNPDNNILIVGRSTQPGTVRSGGSLTLDSAGDIALSADGDQITMNDGTTTRFTFNVDSTPEIDVAGDFTIDGSGDIVIDGADDVIIKNSGTQRIQIEDTTGDVAIGTHDPVYRLDVIKSTSTFVAQIRNDSTTPGADLLVMDFENQSSPSGQIIYVYGGSSSVYRVTGDGDGTSTVSTTFTGFHDTATLQDSDMIPGMIVESTGVPWVKDPSNNYHNMLPYTRLCSDNGSSKVFGVTAKDNQDFIYQADGTKIANTNKGGLRKGEFGGLVTNNPMVDNHVHLSVMSLGEGAIWITNIAGDITNGDLIESSEIAGYGRLQSDDIMRSKTVAKCTEAIDWTTVTDTIVHDGVTYKKYLTSCTFHCG